MGHCLGLATRTSISVCKSPFPSSGTAVSFVGLAVQCWRALKAMGEVWSTRDEAHGRVQQDIDRTVKESKQQTLDLHLDQHQTLTTCRRSSLANLVNCYPACRQNDRMNDRTQLSHNSASLDGVIAHIYLSWFVVNSLNCKTRHRLSLKSPKILRGNSLKTTQHTTAE